MTQSELFVEKSQSLKAPLDDVLTQTDLLLQLVFSQKKSCEYQFGSICVELSPFPAMVTNDGLSPRFLFGGFNTVFA